MVHLDFLYSLLSPAAISAFRTLIFVGDMQIEWSRSAQRRSMTYLVCRHVPASDFSLKRADKKSTLAAMIPKLRLDTTRNPTVGRNKDPLYSSLGFLVGFMPLLVKDSRC